MHCGHSVIDNTDILVSYDISVSFKPLLSKIVKKFFQEALTQNIVKSFHHKVQQYFFLIIFRVAEANATHILKNNTASHRFLQVTWNPFWITSN